MRLFSGTFAALSILFFSISFAQAEEGAQDQSPHCVIAAIDGTGSAKVRRQSGIEQFAAKEMKVFAGDKVTTDASTTVSLFFPDGSIIKVGTNSEYKLTAIAEKNKVISWFSDLVRGSVRAIIENLSLKRKSQYRLSTPEGTIGVRGTDLVLQHDPEANVSEFYLLEGKVEAGPLGCFEKKNCTVINGGERVEFKDKKMSAPRPFAGMDFVGVSKGANGQHSVRLASERLALVEELKRLEGTKAALTAKSSEAVNEELKALELKLRTMQADLLGMDVEMLEKLHKDEKQGLLKNRMAAAERYLKMTENFADDDVMLDARRLALGRTLSEQNEFNDGKFDQKFVNRMAKNDAVKAYTDGPRSVPEVKQASAGWRSAQGNRESYAPSGAIQEQMRNNSAQAPKNVYQPSSRLVNRGGILINEGRVDKTNKGESLTVAKTQSSKPVTSNKPSGSGGGSNTTSPNNGSGSGSNGGNGNGVGGGGSGSGVGGSSGGGSGGIFGAMECFFFSRCGSGRGR